MGETVKLSRYYEEFMQATPSETYLLPSDQNLCPITGEEDCAERSCELHYMEAPIRLSPSGMVLLRSMDKLD
jgi:hypothetical protein